MKLLETTHQFRGYHNGGAICRIEVYTASGLPPLIVATELPENDNTSITNVAEYVAAEVIERYLTADQLAGHDPPFVWVEHYPATEAYGRRGRDETWDLVTFAHYRRERTMRVQGAALALAAAAVHLGYRFVLLLITLYST